MCYGGHPSGIYPVPGGRTCMYGGYVCVEVVCVRVGGLYQETLSHCLSSGGILKRDGGRAGAFLTAT